MHKHSHILIILTLALLLSACTTQNAYIDSALGASDTSEAVIQTTNTSEPSPASHEKFTSEAFKSVNKDQQFVIDDETSRMLANTIKKYLWNDKHIIEEFSDITQITDTAAFQFTALASNKVPSIINLTAVTAEHPDNPISILYNELSACGTVPFSIYYIDDLKDTICDLFGDSNSRLFDLEDGIFESHYGGSEFELTVYNETNAIVSYGSSVFVPGVPQITYYKETDDGFECEAVILPADCLLKLDDNSYITITEENFNEYKEYCSEYRYLFQTTDTGMILTAFESLK